LKTVVLLLDDISNRYQQLLVRKAREQAEQLKIRLLDVQFAGGSGWSQLETINDHLRTTPPADAMLVLLAGDQHTGGWLERAVGRNIAVVFLNRIPPWVGEVRSKFPRALIAGVAPAQLAVGQVQAAQAMRLVRPGAFTILITGAARTPAAIERQRGFLEAVKRQLVVTQIDGQWSPQVAERALLEWLQIGAERGQTIDLVVCQNDAMVVGARRALAKHAKLLGRPELVNIPFIGCDGLEEEGQAMVRQGILTATVLLPVTTPKALDILQRYWNSHAQTATVLLGVESFPPLEKIRPA
jgi:ribose transport system substrate-binding protein